MIKNLSTSHPSQSGVHTSLKDKGLEYFFLLLVGEYCGGDLSRPWVVDVPRPPAPEGWDKDTHTSTTSSPHSSHVHHLHLTQPQYFSCSLLSSLVPFTSLVANVGLLFCVVVGLCTSVLVPRPPGPGGLG